MRPVEAPTEEREEFGRREIALIVALLLVSAFAGTVDVADDALQDALDIVAIAAGVLFWVVLVWLVYVRARVRRRRTSRGRGAAE
jgi:heme/copper-type cytochrome/quinol oxidase subunit 2